MKKNKDLDDLFDFNNSEQKIIKKAKRKSYMRMSSISIFISIVVMVLAILFKLQVTPYILSKEMIEKDTYYAVFGANTYLSPWEEQIKVIGSNATATQYKLLNGQPIFRRVISLDSSIHETYVQPNKNKSYTYYGQNVMHFYHPKVKYESLPKDLIKLNDKDINESIEMAISFDQAYTIEEVQKMLPKETTLNWYWLDIFNENEISSMQKSNQPYAETSAHIFTEDQVVGISTFSKTGEKYENPVKEFMEDVSYGMKNSKENKDDFTNIFNTLTVNGKLKQENIRIIGAVVVGDAHTLAKVVKEPYTRALSIGATTK